MPRFLALGNCTLDDVVTENGAIAVDELGGNGVYAAIGMALWDVDVALVSVIGTDFPETHLATLTDAGIDVSAVKRVDMPHMLRSRAFYLPDGRRTDRVEEARPFLPADAGEIMDLETEYTEMGSDLHRRVWPVFCPSPAQLDCVATAAEYAHLAPGELTNNRQNAAYLTQRRVTTTLDWPWWDWDQEAIPDDRLLRNIDYLLPSVEELRIYADARRKPAFEAARQLLTMGPRAIVVKLGSRGARILTDSDGHWSEVPIYPTDVVDPTGAGDAFCGGFLAGIAETGDPYSAALYGAVSASFIIEDFGPLHALRADGREVRARLEELKRS